MKDDKKIGFFKKIFGQRSSCCSLDIEEIDSNEGKTSDSKDTAPSCCCSTPKHGVKKNEDIKEKQQKRH